MHVLLTSHTYTAIGNHAKLAALAGLPGMELTVVIPERWQDALFSLDHPQAQGNYRLVALPIVGTRPHLFFYRADLGAVLRDVQPDILHIEQEPRSLVTAQWLWANRGRARTVIFTWENCLQPRRFPLTQLERYAIKHADAFIGGNAQAVELLRAKGWRGPASMLPQLGVDPDIAQQAQASTCRQELGLGDEFIVGFAGRLVEEKGIGDLVQAFMGLNQARLFVLGSGPWGERLARFERVHVHPPVPHAEVPRYLAAMDVCVLPSRTTPRWKEQFGHVLIEAMACGVPVVGSDSGAIPEVIGDAGLIYPEGNVTALRDGLRRLQSDAALRADLSARGRARVLANYTHRHIAEQTLQVYQKVLT